MYYDYYLFYTFKSSYPQQLAPVAFFRGGCQFSSACLFLLVNNLQWKDTSISSLDAHEARKTYKKAASSNMKNETLGSTT